MKIHFPTQVIEYLQKAKGDGFSLEKQLARSDKQLKTVKHLFDRFNIQSMLDIGCGLGLSSIMIAKYSNMKYLGLLDGDGTGEIFHDFREDGKPWNDVKIAGILARANLPSRCKCDTFTPKDVPGYMTVDMIVSFKSWGTHYPIGTYLGFAQRAVNPGGLVVVDLRPDDEVFRGAQVARVARAGFELVDTDGERRHVFRKPE